MKISVVGGMDRLEPHYRNEVEKLGYEFRLFNGLESRMSAKIAGSAAVVLFTGKISHEARNQVVAVAKANGIPLWQSHSCGVCSLRNCLACLERGAGPRGLTSELRPPSSDLSDPLPNLT